MPLTPKQLKVELAAIVDPAFAEAIIDSYVEMQQRFLAGDWQPSELDGGRLCEAVARAVYQMNSGIITHSQLPGAICEKLEDEKNQHKHTLAHSDRLHICKAISLVYKFRSSRGSVHISPVYSADFMDSMLMVHDGKWILAEFLRLAWTKDKTLISRPSRRSSNWNFSLIHELEGVPLVLDEKVSAPVEILLLLNHADGHKITRDQVTAQCKNNTAAAVSTAITRLMKANDIRSTPTAGEIALTPKGRSV